MYIYRGDIYCDACGAEIRKILTQAGNAPKDPNDEYTYDSDDFPKYVPSSETDCPQHCGDCAKYLAVPLTSSGVDYAIECLDDYIRSKRGDLNVLAEWADDLGNYSLTDEQKNTLDVFWEIVHNTPTRPLKKTTIVIWSEPDDRKREIDDLAREAMNGNSYCSKCVEKIVDQPKIDPDWDGTEFFDK